MGGDALVEVLSEIKECQARMATKINGMGTEIESHLEAHINKAFAGGDPDGHRRAHEAMIDMIEEKRKLRVAIQEKTISGLIWAAVVFIGLSIFNELRKAILGA
jgi:hypothetical protein